MRIRRSVYAQDLRNAPIDRVDAFLLTRLVDTMDLTELVEIAPCSTDEALERIYGLAELGLVELVSPDGSERSFAPRAGRNPIEVIEEAVTLRPPRLRSVDTSEPVTLWPKMRAPLELDLHGFGEPSETGVRPRPAPITEPFIRPKTGERKR